MSFIFELIELNFIIFCNLHMPVLSHEVDSTRVRNLMEEKPFYTICQAKFAWCNAIIYIQIIFNDSHFEEHDA